MQTDAKRFYILPASDNTGAKAHGPYTKSEANLRALADPGARIILKAKLDAMRAAQSAKAK